MHQPHAPARPLVPQRKQSLLSFLLCATTRPSFMNINQLYSHAGAPAMTHSLSKEGLVESFSIEPTSLEDFKENPDNLCTRVLLKDEAAKVEYTITIQVRGYSSAHGSCGSSLPVGVSLH